MAQQAAFVPLRCMQVNKLGNVSFKEIIAHYRRQPQASQPVYRAVVLEQSNPGLQVQARGDIILFYNQVGGWACLRGHAVGGWVHVLGWGWYCNQAQGMGREGGRCCCNQASSGLSWLRAWGVG